MMSKRLIAAAVSALTLSGISASAGTVSSSVVLDASTSVASQTSIVPTFKAYHTDFNGVTGTEKDVKKSDGGWGAKNDSGFLDSNGVVMGSIESGRLGGGEALEISFGQAVSLTGLDLFVSLSLFDLSKNPDEIGQAQSFSLFVDGVSVIDNGAANPNVTGGVSNLLFNSPAFTGSVFAIVGEGIGEGSQGVKVAGFSFTATMLESQSGGGASAVPLPATAPLLATGLLAGGLVLRRRRKS